MLEEITRPIPKWVVDRIEEDWAVLENTSTLETINLPIIKLPRGTSPGDTLIRQDSKWYKDAVDTEARAARISERFERIKARNS